MIGGDVVVSADGKDIASMQALSQIVRGKQPGDKLNLTVLRDGKEIKVTAELAARSAN